MQDFFSDLNFQFYFDIRASFKIKNFDFHSTKPWCIYITNNNILCLWDYENKLCIKSFSINNLDSEITRIDVKSIRFLDKDTLYWLFQSNQPLKTKEAEIIKNFNKNWVIMVAENKIYFYDYITEQTDVITQNMLSGKNPRKLAIIDNEYLAIGYYFLLIKKLN